MANLTKPKLFTPKRPYVSKFDSRYIAERIAQ